MIARRVRRASVVDEFVAELCRQIKGGINVSELARKSGVTRAYIYRISRREQVPTIAVAERIATHLGFEFRMIDIS